ncbi:MAG: nucleotidyltransferase family protein [Deltaproteobacteria bacterium]|nr:nucleotidyltransferase family protein [Deltaproteobacteria bacterium]
MIEAGALRELCAAALRPEQRHAPVGDALAALARREKLAPLLGGLCLDGRLEAESGARALLVEDHQRCLVQQRVAERALAEAVVALLARDIRPMLLKGMALSRRLFGAGRRSMRDVDLLVPRRQFGAARAALEALGARSDDDGTRRVTMRLFHEVDLRMPSGAAIDLHRGLSPWPIFTVDHPAVLARGAREADGLLVPDPSDLLVMLAMHAAGDGFAVPLRAVVDGLLLAPLARAHEVLERAQGWHARRATAAWLWALLGYGLAPDGGGGPGWRGVAETLDGSAGAHALARLVPSRLPRRLRMWHLRARTAWALDGVARPAVFYSWRGLLYVGDWVMRRSR